MRRLFSVSFLALTLIACSHGGGGTAANTPAPTTPSTPDPSNPNPTPATNDPAVILTPPTSTTVPLGQTATFKVDAGGTAPLNYAWTMNASPVGTNAATYTTPATTSADNNASIVVKVSNTGGSMTSLPATLVVTSPLPSGGDATPPAFVGETDLMFCADTKICTAQFPATLNGGPATLTNTVTPVAGHSLLAVVIGNCQPGTTVSTPTDSQNDLFQLVFSTASSSSVVVYAFEALNVKGGSTAVYSQVNPPSGVSGIYCGSAAGFVVREYAGEIHGVDASNNQTFLSPSGLISIPVTTNLPNENVIGVAVGDMLLAVGNNETDWDSPFNAMYTAGDLGSTLFAIEDAVATSAGAATVSFNVTNTEGASSVCDIYGFSIY